MGPGLFGLIHIPVIAVVIVLILGPARLAALGRYLGAKIKDLRKTVSGQGKR
ncbi:MAG: twin-arginine translocase TatA/TatE family subunit [Desulfovibrionaceae bacterium]|nr:twin-arginine translocase TatA/TatE family subunit [Desulfovibrionaceae bacterium]MBF0515026.1 twin-arginine translocase TatA/TatE family subunit [Desulfovibrionaceae bacterium]